MEESNDIVFSKNTVEFVTVAAEYCVYIEQSAGKTRKEFAGTLLKLLPLLYLKAQMLPEDECVSDVPAEDFVNENDYEEVRETVAAIMAERDDYLEVFVSDMKYSDTPIRKTISEDLADIYQDIKNFVSLFRTGLNSVMHDAVVECGENFSHYWGQTLVNTLRALHDVQYNSESEADDENNKEEEDEDI